MEERWLSIKQVAEIIGKSEQTVLDYCNESKFPNATKPGGGKSSKWAVPESDVKAFMTGKPAVPPPTPKETPEAVERAREDAEVAKAQEEAAIARKHAEAAKAGFETSEDWEKAQADFKALIEKNNKESAIEKEQNAKLKQYYDEQIAQNKEIEKQLKEQLKLANEKIMEHENINIEAKKTTEANINRILKHFKGGTIGIMEKAVYMLTQPIVERAFLQYKCADCHKDGSDKINRTAIFEIPRLKDCPPNFAFRICPDCEPDQRNNRNLPFYICDICPIDKLMKQSAQLILEALATVGVEAEFDADGQYRPTTYIDEKKRHLTKEEQLRLLMQGYGIGEEDKEVGDKNGKDKLAKGREK